ncbi:MAG TPA: hypothetical protein PK680_02770 [Novosphingobium sp.]|nr:hypothetical protein [Novosphingobium sp.]
MDTTTIEIDFEVYKLIEAERRSFSETPLSALRRLLKLPERQPQSEYAQPIQSSGKVWSDDGVVVPHGSRARMEYGRGSQRYEGQFLDGMLVVNGSKFSSLSEAASALAKTKDGRSTSLNGWNYWEVQFPESDRWEPMEHLRRRAKGKSIF